MDISVMYSSKDMTWTTPQPFFDKLNEEFNFTLDPCCFADTAKCKKFYTPVEDGLKQNWEGETVFVNPPYGKEIKHWIKKSYEEGQKPNTKVVMLIPSRTDTKWFHDYIYNKAEIRFVKGRLKFGGGANSAPFPSMVVVFSKEITENLKNKWSRSSTG